MGPLFAFAAFGLASGLVGREIHVFERAAAAEIRKQLKGDNVKVTVKAEPDGLGVLWGALDRATITASHFEVDGIPLFVEPERSKAGRCGNLTLKLSDFKLRGLRIDSLFAEIPACRYDRSLALKSKTFRLSKSGVGRGTVRVLERDLAAFILKKYGEIKTVSVKVYNGIVWVEGTGEFLVVKSSFTVIADLTPVDGTKLTLTNAKVWFDWRRADDFATQTLLKTLNPVVDFDKDLGLMGAIKVDKVRLENGVVEATGMTQIPVRAASSGTSRESKKPLERRSNGSSYLLPLNAVRT